MLDRRKQDDFEHEFVLIRNGPENSDNSAQDMVRPGKGFAGQAPLIEKLLDFGVEVLQRVSRERATHPQMQISDHRLVSNCSVDGIVDVSRIPETIVF
jgi:hypothetical protein